MHCSSSPEGTLVDHAAMSELPSAWSTEDVAGRCAVILLPGYETFDAHSIGFTGGSRKSRST